MFVLTLPLSNPWVRGDGVGYYAYVRSLLIEKHLDFEKDWEHGNESFVMGRLDSNGHVLASQYTSTGHIANPLDDRAFDPLGAISGCHSRRDPVGRRYRRACRRRRIFDALSRCDGGRDIRLWILGALDLVLPGSQIF